MTPNQMKSHLFLQWVLILFIILITFNHSQAKQPQAISEKLDLDEFLNAALQWMTNEQQSQITQLKFTAPVVLAGVLCFIAASISSAGGIGGGGLFIPILTLVAGLDLKAASSFSAFMVTGGSIANVFCNMFITNPNFGGKTLIDYDIALLSEPCMLLGVSIGVICNLVFPEWLITILFAVFLAWSSFKTCSAGVLYWKLESEEMRRNGCEKLENGVVKDEINCDGSDMEPLLNGKEKCKLGTPWIKLGILIMIWFSFLVVYLLRGNRYGQVTAATSSFMVFFSSTMSAVQYLLLGMEHTFSALTYAVICFVASLIGLMVVQKAIRNHARASLIVFSVGTVMIISTVLMTSFGALDVWRDYTSGRYMGFKQPC